MKKITLILSLMVAMVTTAMAQVDYTPKNVTATRKTNTNRPMQTVKVGNETYTLNATEQTTCYVDKYNEQTFTVEAGNDVSFEITTSGSWIHGVVYIDFDNDGFTAGVTNTWKPTGDLISYAFYNNNSSSDESGWNSKGQTITGNDRNKPAIPSYVIPENTPAGEYRIRFKLDWCNIDPDGDADGKFKDFMDNGGQILDAKLVVTNSGSTVEPTPDPEEKPEEGNTYEDVYAAIEKPIITGFNNPTYIESATISNGNGIQNHSENIIPAELAVKGQKGRTDFIEVEAGATFDLNMTFVFNWCDINIIKIEKGVAEIIYGPFEGSWPDSHADVIKTHFSNADLAVNGNTVTFPIALSNDLQEGDMVVIRTIIANDYYLNSQESYSDAAYMDFVFVVPTKDAETAIENVNVETANNVIYDITGRRVKEITNAGIYIINGKKTFVK